MGIRETKRQEGQYILRTLVDTHTGKKGEEGGRKEGRVKGFTDDCHHGVRGPSGRDRIGSSPLLTPYLTLDPEERRLRGASAHPEAAGAGSRTLT